MSYGLSAANLPRAVYFVSCIYIIVVLTVSIEIFKSAYLAVLKNFPQAQNLFRRWNITSPRFRFNVTWAPDEFQSKTFCQQCKETLASSQLLFGSPWYVTRRVELLEYHGSLWKLRHTGDDYCHLCALLWFSVKGRKRQAILEEDDELQLKLRQPVDAPDGNEHRRLYLRSRRDDFPSRFAFELRNRYAAHRHVALAQRLLIKLWKPDSSTNLLRVQLLRGAEAIGSQGIVYEDKCKKDSVLQFSIPVPLTNLAGFPDCRTGPVRFAHGSSSTDSTYHFDIARKWIKDCVDSHDLCQAYRRVRVSPTRLIYVSLIDGKIHTRLHIVGGTSESLEYLTLSHRWGGAQLLTLNAQNFELFKNGIPWGDLPKTFQDAILATQRLGFSYIWIDSLCILQDSESDWTKESALMGSIYAGSTCTIAATGANNGNDGCFKTRDVRGLVDCTIVDTPDGRDLRVCMCDSLETSFENQVNASPLNARAWVFQERMLSTRILHFAAKLIFWECQICTIAETHPYSPIYRKFDHDGQATIEGPGLVDLDNRRNAVLDVQPRNTQQPAEFESLHASMEDYRTAFEYLKRFSAEGTGHNQHHTFTRYWYELVSRYSLGGLTKANDKLVAIFGVAAEIEIPTGLTYLSGLWKQYLIYNLLWSVDTPANSRPYVLRAPSWSWASLDGMVKYQQEDDISSYDRTGWATVLSADSYSPKTSAKGIVSCGSITLKGVLRKLRATSLENLVKSGVSYPLRDPHGKQSGRWYPDVLREFHEVIFVLEILRLSKRPHARGNGLWLTLGLVLSLCESDSQEEVFRRVGYYSSGVVHHRTKRSQAFDGSKDRLVRVI